MWDLPGPGLEPVSPALAGGFLTTAPPGKSLPTPPFYSPSPAPAFPLHPAWPRTFVVICPSTLPFALQWKSPLTFSETMTLSEWDTV